MRARPRARPLDLWWAAALPWVAYALALGATSRLRWEHVVVAALAGVTVTGGARARSFFVHALPFFVLFLLYDSMRYWGDLGVAPDRVLGCELRDLELAWFGVVMGGRLQTLNDVFVAHHQPLVDLLVAIPYGAYIPVMIGTFAWLYARDRDAAMRFAWIALATHLLGFLTYHLAPAAPPWYVRAHGCVIDPAATTSAAGLERVDALLGVRYFDALYGRGSAVFGALPSLHVTYPLYGIFATLRRCPRPALGVQIVYAATMVFAAIYLDHHYVVDVLLGVTYALVAFVVVSLVMRSSPPRPRGAAPTAPPALGSRRVAS